MKNKEEQVIMQTVHNVYSCEQCEWCNVWYVPEKGHKCEKSQLEASKEGSKEVPEQLQPAS